MPATLPASSTNLRRMRIAKGWSQYQLARKSGLTSVTVWNLENGRTKGQPATWQVLADALGVAVDELTDVA